MERGCGEREQVGARLAAFEVRARWRKLMAGREVQEPPRQLRDLSRRQFEILRLMANGCSTRRIAKLLSLTKSEVKVALADLQTEEPAATTAGQGDLADRRRSRARKRAALERRQSQARRMLEPSFASPGSVYSAAAFVTEVLRNGPRSAVELFEEGRRYGHCPSAVEAAANELGVLMLGSLWQLPLGLVEQLEEAETLRELPLARDATGCLIGYRCWNISQDDNGVRLTSGFVNSVWPGTQPFVARCGGGGRRHTPPGESCQCGVYALSETQGYPYYGGFRNHGRLGRIQQSPAWQVFGKVYLWGEVIRATNGFRAQFAYPKVLYLAHKDWVFAKPLREAYRVPVELRNPFAERGVGDEHW